VAAGDHRCQVLLNRTDQFAGGPAFGQLSTVPTGLAGTPGQAAHFKIKRGSIGYHHRIFLSSDQMKKAQPKRAFNRLRLHFSLPINSKET
jgi:hypothetical protein